MTYSFSGSGQKFMIALLALALVCLSAAFAQAVEIKRIKTQAGIEAWLVEDHSIPLIALRFAVPAGSSHDPKGKTGLANFAASLLDEGAGDLDAAAFHTRLQELAVRLSFNTGKDWFYGRLQTLSRNKEKAFELLKLAITSPRFDDEPVARVRGQIAISLRRDAQSPRRVASQAWISAALGPHPYALPTKGRAMTLQAITRQDLKDFAARTFVRSGLRIAVVGAITPDQLKQQLDRTFAGLPRGKPRKPLGEAAIAPGPLVKFKQMNVPQTVIQFGHAGLKRKDKDFIPAYIINYILGGGGFSSRLTREIRVKRGLTYSVYSYLNPLKYAGLFMGGAATRADRASQTLALIRRELAKMAKHGPTPEELSDAKTYLTGSYALRFDTSSKIAGQLLGMQIEDLGIDYIKTRNAKIMGVSPEDIKRVAARLLKPGRLIVAVVGRTPPAMPVDGKKLVPGGLEKPKKPL
jgi:zinc protease